MGIMDGLFGSSDAEKKIGRNNDGVTSDSLKKTLNALPIDEQYTLVIRGLASAGDTAAAIDVVDEMTTRQIPLTPDSVCTLIDAALGDDELPTALLRLKANGACSAYGMAQPRAVDASSPANLPAVPEDESDVELAAAAAAGVLATGAALAHPPAALLLPGLASAWGWDRYTQQGSAFDVLTKGLARLDQGPLSRDLTRESALDAASFLIGYVLGLPCCASAPTVEEPLALLRDASLWAPHLTPPAGARLVDRFLIWLLAAPTLEALLYAGEARQTNPKLALDFLRAVRRREASLGIDVQQGGWRTGTTAEDLAEGDDMRLRWAYAEARSLLKRCSGVREALEERMAEGTSVGESVVMVEERLRAVRL